MLELQLHKPGYGAIVFHDEDARSWFHLLDILPTVLRGYLSPRDRGSGLVVRKIQIKATNLSDAGHRLKEAPGRRNPGVEETDRERQTRR